MSRCSAFAVVEGNSGNKRRSNNSNNRSANNNKTQYVSISTSALALPSVSTSTYTKSSTSIAAARVAEGKAGYQRTCGRRPPPQGAAFGASEPMRQDSTMHQASLSLCLLSLLMQLLLSFFVGVLLLLMLPSIGSKRPQIQSKSQDGSKRPEDGSKRLQDAPKRPQEEQQEQQQ